MDEEELNNNTGFGFLGNQYRPDIPSQFTGTENLNELALWGEIALNAAPSVGSAKALGYADELTAVGGMTAGVAAKAGSKAGYIANRASDDLFNAGKKLLEKAATTKQTLTSKELFKAAIASEGKFKYIKTAGKTGWTVMPVAAPVAAGATVAMNTKELASYMSRDEVWESMTEEGGIIDIAAASGDTKTILDFQNTLFNYDNLSYNILAYGASQNAAENFFWIQKKANEALKNSGSEYVPSTASQVVLNDKELKVLWDKYAVNGKLYATGGDEGEISLAAFGGGLIEDIKNIQESKINTTPLFYANDTGDGTGWYIKSSEYVNALENWMNNKPEYADKVYGLMSEAERNSVVSEFQNAEDGQKSLLTDDKKLSAEQYAIAGEVDKFTNNVASLGLNVTSPSDYNIVNGSIVSTTEKDVNGNFKTIAAAGTAEAQVLTEAKTTYETNKVQFDSIMSGESKAEADAEVDAQLVAAENQWYETITQYEYLNGIPIAEDVKRSMAKERAASGYSSESASGWKTEQRAQDADTLIGLYPQWESAIRAGSDVRTLAGGWLSKLQEVYGVDATQVSLSDPLLAPAISGSKDGKPYAMSPAEYASWLRKQDAYFGTEEAANKYSSLAQLLDSKFGI
jgi:hypothetical protein